MTSFFLQQFDPCPVSRTGVLDGDDSASQLVALDIHSKYLFVDESGETYHEYPVPGTPDVQNCGGYVDKVIQYRDPALLDYLLRHGVSSASFAASPFPILGTRSPKLDLLLFDCMRYLRTTCAAARVSLLDHGCTVAEHYDLLDVMLRASSHGRDTAVDVLTYCGLDKSSMLLTIARLLHARVPDQHFALVQAEGSAFDFKEGQFDLSLSVGVINHVVQPVEALQKLLKATRHACVLALWVTLGEEGFWAFNHSGVPNYFFSRTDLRRLLHARGQGRFYSLEFTPEAEASQQRSYVGVGAEKLRLMGSCQLVFSTLPELPFQAEELAL